MEKGDSGQAMLLEEPGVNPTWGRLDKNGLQQCRVFFLGVVAADFQRKAPSLLLAARIESGRDAGRMAP